MKQTTYLAAFLLFAWPVLAQNPTQQQPPAQNPPAQNPPALEKPQDAAEPAPEENKPAPAKKPDALKNVAPAAKRAGESEGRVVEEIVARVNNEIITKSELDRARAAAEEDARQDCSGKCTPARPRSMWTC